MSKESEHRSYKEIGKLLKEELQQGIYQVGERLPPERDLADRFNVSRTVIREACIMLELENLVSVKKGSGIYVIRLPNEEILQKEEEKIANDVGPFELLQARQLLESSIAEFAAIQATPNDLIKLKDILLREKKALEKGTHDYKEDEEFHRAIAEITQNEVLIQMQKAMWKYRDNSMWKGLHTHISNQQYRQLWLTDHEEILKAIQHKNPMLAKKMMWQHLENVKKKLFELSDVESPDFDGFLYQTNPVVVGI